jgi:hypothetical protein
VPGQPRVEFGQPCQQPPGASSRQARPSARSRSISRGTGAVAIGVWTVAQEQVELSPAVKALLRARAYDGT